MSLSELQEMVMDREAWRAVIHGVTKSRNRLSNWTELNWTEKCIFLSPSRSDSRSYQILYLVKFGSSNGRVAYSGLSSVQFSCWVLSNFLWTPWTAEHQVFLSIIKFQSESCPSIQWCHPTISSSVILFSSSLQSCPSSGSFLMSQFFTSDGQSIGVQL